MPPMRSASIERARRRLVQRRRVAQRPFDELLEERDRGVGEQQARDRLVDAAVLAQRAGQRDPGARRPPSPATHTQRGADDVAGQRHRIRQRRRRRAPPSTSAPSPPMMIRPARAGSATHSAVSISGAARCSVFCHENQSPNAPLNSSVQVSTGLAPPSQTKHAEQQQRARPARRPAGRRRAAVSVRTAARASRGDQAEPIDAFDEVVHLLELDVGLLDRLARGDHDLALVVLQARRAARKMSKLPASIFAFTSSAFFFAASLTIGAVRRHLDVALLQAAAQEVRVRLAGLRAASITVLYAVSQFHSAPVR